jgi:hypothetical protein
MTFPDTHIMTSNFANDLAKPDENSQTDHEREFDRWRTAVELIQRMREAGIGCDKPGIEGRFKDLRSNQAKRALPARKYSRRYRTLISTKDRRNARSTKRRRQARGHVRSGL